MEAMLTIGNRKPAGVRTELELLTKLYKFPKEHIDDYKFRLVEKADTLIGDDEFAWKSLSKEAQTWMNLCIEAFQNDKAPPEFPEQLNLPKQKKVKQTRTGRLDPKLALSGKEKLDDTTKLPMATSVVKYIYEMVVLNPDISITEVKQNLHAVGLFATDGTIKGKRNDVRVIISILMKHGKYRVR